MKCYQFYGHFDHFGIGNFLNRTNNPSYVGTLSLNNHTANGYGG